MDRVGSSQPPDRDQGPGQGTAQGGERDYNQRRGEVRRNGRASNSVPVRNLNARFARDTEQQAAGTQRAAPSQPGIGDVQPATSEPSTSHGQGPKPSQGITLPRGFAFSSEATRSATSPAVHLTAHRGDPRQLLISRSRPGIASVPSQRSAPSAWGTAVPRRVTGGQSSVPEDRWEEIGGSQREARRVTPVKPEAESTVVNRRVIELTKLKLRELKTLCEARDLPHSGLKEQVVMRLVQQEEVQRRNGGRQ